MCKQIGLFYALFIMSYTKYLVLMRLDNSPLPGIGIYTSIIFFYIKEKNKDKALILFSSPQPSPAGEGARDKCNLLLFIGYKLV